MNPNISSNMSLIQQNQDINTMEVEQMRTMREIKKQDEFKPVKSKLPIDIDTFLQMNIEGISIKKEQNSNNY